MKDVYTIDYGTPVSNLNKTVNLIINGKAVQVAEETSLMRAAMEIGADVPKLCATDSLDAFGSCRICMVEIEGRKAPVAACHTPVVEGMVINTESGNLTRWRKNLVELYMTDHPLDSLSSATKTKTGADCELQEIARVYDLTDVRYPKHQEKNHLHLAEQKDESNPYFTFDSSKCIVCSRCVRACDEIQGTLALTIEGRGFDSRVSVDMGSNFLDSSCVSCGACVQACPTEALIEKSVINFGLGEKKTVTTCAYCGVGCSFEAHTQGDKVVRMLPYKDGKANHGHSCVKGRFAWEYATHEDRIIEPMIRESIEDEWRKVSWEEAIGFTADKIKSIQKKYGINAVGGITSSRCTNEENYLVQKLVRAVFQNNNVDTCARVCHSPTGYGLKRTFGTSAGTQNFDSVEKADLIMVIGANPTEAHPVFASRMKRCLRDGAQLIVLDPRKIDLVKSPHIKADVHLPLRPGTNVAVLNSIAHTIVKEQLQDQGYINDRCDVQSFNAWIDFISQKKNSPEAIANISGLDSEAIKQAARLYARAPNAAIYYGLGVTEHSQGSSTVMSIANLAMLTGNIGREGVGVNPLRGQNNVQGSCDMGSFPHELPGYRHVSDASARSIYETEWKVKLSDDPGWRIPNMFDAAMSNIFKGMYIQGEDLVQSDPNMKHVIAAFKNMECVIVQDIFYTETAKYAHVFLPGASFLEKDGTFTNAERRINRVRQVTPPLAGIGDWEVTCALAKSLGYDMDYSHPSEIMDEIARTTPSFAGVSYELLDRVGSVQWPCNEDAPEGTPTMHINQFVRGKGCFVNTEYVPTHEKTNRRFPLLLTTGRVLSQYNVGTQTRRTQNNAWENEDRVEIHPSDAEVRGIIDGSRISVTSRAGTTYLRATITEKVELGVVYTTFHFPESNTNIVTTENSDWATNCPEYKVTAVEVLPCSEGSQQKAS